MIYTILTIWTVFAILNTALILAIARLEEEPPSIGEFIVVSVAFVILGPIGTHCIALDVLDDGEY